MGTIFEKIAYEFDVNLLLKDIVWLKDNNYLGQKDHQVCLTGINTNSDWRDGVGKLLDRYPQYEKSIDVEKQFVHWLPEFNNLYAKDVYDVLRKRWKLGRVRLMEVLPKTCYSWHKDVSKRLHVPIYTDHTRCGLIIEDTVYRMPADGNAYLADTTLYHTAFNSMDQSRYHLVAVIVDDE
jgi:Aspartyl/Asparaginyl beta-hydroxylase